MTFPTFVKIVEVSPRDGLQSEPTTIDATTKIEFINRLSETGLKAIEVTSFVSPKWIPQLADHTEVLQGIKKKPGISYPVFVPNANGLKKALAAGVCEIAVFSTPSEEFCKRNVNCSVEECLQRVADITTIAKEKNIPVRGYISCVLGCPYEGEISPEAVLKVAEKLIALGCYEISLGDTIGVGTPLKTKKLLETILPKIPAEKLAVHFHDTYGQALANIYVALEKGIAVVDSSVAGLGGCPYAKGASGNVATEDVLYMLNGMNIKTGIDLKKLMAAGDYMLQHLHKSSHSKAGQAMSGK